MMFPVGAAVDGLCADQHQAADKTGFALEQTQYVVFSGSALRAFHRAFHTFSAARRRPTVGLGNGLEAVMGGDWTPIGELAKRLIEKQGRGK